MKVIDGISEVGNGKYTVKGNSEIFDVIDHAIYYAEYKAGDRKKCKICKATGIDGKKVCSDCEGDRWVEK